jgi:vaccinia related kinase
MPERFDESFVLKDIFKTTWTLGKPIGQGGFGLIYLGIYLVLAMVISLHLYNLYLYFIKAYKGETKGKGEADYVIKIEPKDNGPLFCETHFYVNCAKEDDCMLDIDLFFYKIIKGSFLDFNQNFKLCLIYLKIIKEILKF